MFDPFSQQGAGELNVLKRHLQSTVLTLLDRNTSQREIHRLTGVDRKTIRRYQALRAGAEANSPGEVTTGSVSADGQIPPPRPPAFGTSEATVTSSLARSACEAHRTWIEEQVRLKRNAQAIYQDLVDQFGFPSSYQSVKRFVRRLRHADPEQFDRLEFLPGEEAQVDYGEGAPTVDPKSGRYRRPRLFVMTLRYSRRSFRRVVWKSSQQVWAQLHEEAFRYFGGVPSYVVLDNLKEGVLKPDLYEPQLNPIYSAMLAHYAVVADPARVADPNRKGCVENAIQHTQGTALAGRRFETLEAQNEFLRHWEENWASKRIHGSTRRQVEAMFQEEKPHLRPLPVAPFRIFTEVVRTVCDDTTVRVDNSYYAARPAPIGSQVVVRIYTTTIEIRDRHTRALLRVHSRMAHPGSVVLPTSERPFNPSRQTARAAGERRAHRTADQGLVPAGVRHRRAPRTARDVGHCRAGPEVSGAAGRAGLRARHRQPHLPLQARACDRRAVVRTGDRAGWSDATAGIAAHPGSSADPYPRGIRRPLQPRCAARRRRQWSAGRGSRRSRHGNPRSCRLRNPGQLRRHERSRCTFSP
ncbi:transposase [Bradyrhizobium diazoefficiens]